MPKVSDAERTPVTRLELKRVGLLEWVKAEDKLQKSPLLHVLGDQARSELLSGAVTRRFAPRTSVFDAGDSGASLFLILRGEVRQVVRAESGSIDVGVLHPGEFFGEDVVLLPGSSRQCAALAMGDLDVAEFSCAQLAKVGEREPKLLQEIQRIHRLRQEAREEMLAFVGRW